MPGASLYGVWLASTGLWLSCVRGPGPATSVDKRCPADAPAVSVPAAARDSLPKGVFWSAMKEQWAEVAREVPGGFGGVLNEGGPVIYLVDTTRRADAIAALVARGVLPVAKG